MSTPREWAEGYHQQFIESDMTKEEIAQASLDELITVINGVREHTPDGIGRTAYQEAIWLRNWARDRLEEPKTIIEAYELDPSVPKSLLVLDTTERAACWLLMTLHENGQVQCRAICTTEAMAAKYLRGINHMLNDEWAVNLDRIVRAWIESGILNHLFASSLYGEGL